MSAWTALLMDACFSEFCILMLPLSNSCRKYAVGSWMGCPISGRSVVVVSPLLTNVQGLESHNRIVFGRSAVGGGIG